MLVYFDYIYFLVCVFFFVIIFYSASKICAIYYRTLHGLGDINSSEGCTVGKTETQFHEPLMHVGHCVLTCVRVCVCECLCVYVCSSLLLTPACGLGRTAGHVR